MTVMDNVIATPNTRSAIRLAPKISVNAAIMYG